MWDNDNTNSELQKLSSDELVKDSTKANLKINDSDELKNENLKIDDPNTMKNNHKDMSEGSSEESTKDSTGKDKGIEPSKQPKKNDKPNVEHIKQDPLSLIKLICTNAILKLHQIMKNFDKALLKRQIKSDFLPILSKWILDESALLKLKNEWNNITKYLKKKSNHKSLWKELWQNISVYSQLCYNWDEFLKSNMKEKDDISREIESIQTIMERIRFEEGKEKEELTSNISFKCLSKIEIKTLNYCFCN